MFRIVRALRVILPLAALAGCPGGAVSYDYSSLPNPTKIPYQVRPGDVVFVRVIRNANTTGRYTVRPDGFISLPLGGEIKIAGLSTDEVRERVVQRLRKFIEDAKDMIAVSLETVRGISYSVIGEVTRAGTFQSTRYVTLLEALANAGGLNPYAKRHGIYVLRRAGGKQLKIPVSYTQTVEDPSGNRNFYLLSGDVIVVP